MVPNWYGLIAYQSDRIEELVDHLAVEMEWELSRRGIAEVDRPFISHKVVVPTKNLEAYLQFELAARRGVVANMEFITLENFLEELLPRDEEGESEVRLLDQTALTRLVLSVLESEALDSDPALAPVKAFLEAGSDGARSRARRHYQLAFRVARLFEEYGYARQRLMRHWKEGNRGIKREYPERATAAHEEIEAWQLAIWRAIFGPGGLASELEGDDERPLMTLPQAVMHHLRRGDELAWPKMIHLFGHSYFPRFFSEFFETRREAQGHRVALYVMNPSQEYWADGVAGDRQEDPVFEILDEESLLQGDDYPLPLAIWGRAGRDYQRMIDDVARERVDIPRELLGGDGTRERHTLLHHFQAMIRHMEPADEVFEEHPFPSDQKSVNLWSCASVQRECEAIASEIWELVSTHDDLRFNDIGVVVQPGDRDIYQTHLQAAFDQTGGIPSNVIDVEEAGVSPYLEACRLLLELPLGSFNRREFLALLVHPCVVANYEEAEPELWQGWCDQLNIYQGADQEDLAGTYLDEDRFTWGQGMKRLVLGAFMEEATDRAVKTVSLGSQEYLPMSADHGELDALGRLQNLVFELIDDARRWRREKRSLEGWIDEITQWISRHVEPTERQERRTRMRFMGGLGRVADGDCRPGEKIDYATALEFALAAMGELEQTRGHYLADGVVVSAFRPMRPIPFEAVFITGLGEGKFPAPDPPDMLDLRRVKSEPHDVNPRYQDQYMFLETLISTRSRLYLSWVGRHAVTGDRLEPASTVHQFREMLLEMVPSGERGQEVEGQLEEQLQIIEHPLRRYDKSYFPQISGQGEVERIDARGPDGIPAGPDEARQEGEPRWEARLPNHHREAAREAQMKAVRELLDERLPKGYRPSMGELSQLLDGESFGRLASQSRWVRPESKGEDEAGAKTRSMMLRLRDLREFLKCPMQGSAKVVLGLYDEEEEDLIAAESEPFESDFLTRLMLVRRALNECFSEGQWEWSAMEAKIDEIARVAELRGDLPAGFFFDAERKRCLGEMGSYRKGLLKQGIEEGTELRHLRVGGGGFDEAVDEHLEALVLDVEIDGERRAVELHGSAALFDIDGGVSWLAAAGSSAKFKYVVEVGLEQIFLRALGREVSGRAVVATKRSYKSQAVDLEAMTPEGARAYLSGLVEDLFGEVHDYHMPVEFVGEVLKKGDDIDDYWESSESYKYKRYGRSSSQYGPIRRWKNVDSLEKDQVLARVERRFQPFVAIMRGSK